MKRGVLLKNIYVSHSKDYDYKKELYEPIRQSDINNRFNIVLPHEKSEKPFNSKEFFSSGNCDYMIAEVSYSATGLGIELGWADCYGVNIIAIVKKGSKVSGSVKILTDIIIEYENIEDLLNKLVLYLK